MHAALLSCLYRSIHICIQKYLITHTILVIVYMNVSALTYTKHLVVYSCMSTLQLDSGMIVRLYLFRISQSRR